MCVGVVGARDEVTAPIYEVGDCLMSLYRSELRDIMDDKVFKVSKVLEALSEHTHTIYFLLSFIYSIVFNYL